MTEPSLTIAFFGHDALESTIVKRTRGFAEQSCLVNGFMFSRQREDLRLRLDCPVVDLGITRDRSYLQRLPLLVLGVVRAWRARATLRRAHVLYARNLDMLAVAFAARLCSGARGRVVYEVLDIQRPMLRSDLAGRVLRWVERQLLRRCALLVVSSPAFVSQYFIPVQRLRSDWLLLENKVPATSLGCATTVESKPPGLPWVIGWFGTLRCRRSFRMLCRLADDLGQRVEIRLAGRPSPSDLSQLEIETEVSRRPNMIYLGGYENPRDLPSLYRPVHFAWCVDYLDEGANSDWLIPNRIYEGGLHGCVALGRRATTSGGLIEERGLGLGLSEPIEPAVRALFEQLTAADYRILQDRLSGNPRSMFVDEYDTFELVARLRRDTGQPGMDARGAPPGLNVRVEADHHSAMIVNDDLAVGIDPAGAGLADERPGRITRVAVIIPYFQRDPGILANALQSVAGQRFDWPVDLDVIIVDDESPCSPEPELEGLPLCLRVRIIKRQNGGPGAARNTGLDSMTRETEAVAFLDSDDIWTPDHLASALRGLGADSDFYFCDHLRPDGVSSHFERVSQQAGDLLRIAESRQAVGLGTEVSRLGAEDERRLMFCSGAMNAFVQQYWAHTSCVVYRVSQMPELRFDATLRAAGEDYLFTLHLVCKARKVCFSPQIHVKRGLGVNMYDSAADWNHPKNLGLVFDNFRCFLRAVNTISGENVPTHMMWRRLSSLRTKFIYVFLRKILLTRTIEKRILSQACSEDKGFMLHVPWVAVVVGIKKALGMHVPELV